jgi:trimeric autotransporter adhesin
VVFGLVQHGRQTIGNASIALLRISATAPTASQIAKIYNDEKFLFQDNAQATLYGASDAVTALAHDPVTDLLHVGTSAGRSVFSGLRRVSNTTTAVGTAISASNSLVVEE